MSFRLSFHQAPLGPSGAHWLDDPSDLTCKDSTQHYPVDDPLPSCKQQVGGSSPSASSTAAALWPSRRPFRLQPREQTHPRCPAVLRMVWVESRASGEASSVMRAVYGAVQVAEAMSDSEVLFRSSAAAPAGSLQGQRAAMTLTRTEEVRGSNPLTSTPPIMTSGIRWSWSRWEPLGGRVERWRVAANGCRRHSARRRLGSPLLGRALCVLW